ncbi:IS66 family transposase zinc-finger binding domain-containing protein [Sporosarcina luteola]
MECVHYNLKQTACTCCHHAMTEIGTTVVHEEVKLIPAKMVKAHHFEYT